MRLAPAIATVASGAIHHHFDFWGTLVPAIDNLLEDLSLSVTRLTGTEVKVESFENRKTDEYGFAMHFCRGERTDAELSVRVNKAEVQTGVKYAGVTIELLDGNEACLPPDSAQHNLAEAVWELTSDPHEDAMQRIDASDLADQLLRSLRARKLALR